MRRSNSGHFLITPSRRRQGFLTIVDWSTRIVSDVARRTSRALQPFWDSPRASVYTDLHENVVDERSLISAVCVKARQAYSRRVAVSKAVLSVDTEQVSPAWLKRHASTIVNIAVFVVLVCPVWSGDHCLHGNPRHRTTLRGMRLDMPTAAGNKGGEGTPHN